MAATLRAEPAGSGCVLAARAALGVLRLGALGALPPPRLSAALAALSDVDEALRRLELALDPSHAESVAPPAHEREVTR